MSYNWQRNLPNVRFTYNNSQSYHPPPARIKPYEIVESRRLRTGSLPPQKVNVQNKPQYSNHIKIIQDASFNQRKRKHRIFQESPLVKRDSTSKSRRKSQTIFGQYKRNSLQKTPQKETQSRKLQTQNDEELISGKKVTDYQQKSNKKESITQELGTTQLHRYIDNKLTQKLTSIYLLKGEENFKHTFSNQQAIQKQQQINYLKLQVQRLKRCQQLNKQNQQFYKKIVNKLKEHQKGQKRQRSSKNVSPVKTISKSNSPRKDIEIQTPINHLYGLKKLQRQNQQKQLIFKQNEPHDNKGVFPNPQHTILSPQDLFVHNEKVENTQSVNQKRFSKEISFNNNLKQVGIVKKHSRRTKIQLIPSMLQIKQQILYNQVSKQAISQMVIENRLQQINNQLQRKLSRRSTSRPNRDHTGSFNNNSVKLVSSYQTNPKHQMFLY